MIDSLPWDALQSFLAIVRSGRLTIAARQLGVTHSTLSRRVTKLEAALGVAVFHRGTTGYALTAQGERLLEAAQSIESLALTAVAEISGDRLHIAGTIRIGAPDGIGTVFLAPLLGRLGALHPDLAIQLVTLPRIFSLSKREADIAIGLTAPEEGRLHARRLTDYELGLFGSADYLACNPKIGSMDDLRGHRFIGYIDDMIYTPELNYLPIVSRDIRPGFVSSNLVAQLNATAAGHGLCILPLFMTRQTPGLKRVLPEAVALTRSFWLIVHSDMRDMARVRIVSDFITQETRRAAELFRAA
jgi:DNA-binding transcriptional LysR family regulator